MDFRLSLGQSLAGQGPFAQVINMKFILENPVPSSLTFAHPLYSPHHPQ